MTSEARAVPGLDPGRGARQRPRWDRGSHGSGGREAARGAATYAALDLGTNNCRLLVARPTNEAFRVVDAFSRIIRLSFDGSDQNVRVQKADLRHGSD